MKRLNGLPPAIELETALDVAELLIKTVLQCGAASAYSNSLSLGFSLLTKPVCRADAGSEATQAQRAVHALEYRFGSRQPLGFSVKSEANIASVTGPVGACQGPSELLMATVITSSAGQG